MEYTTMGGTVWKSEVVKGLKLIKYTIDLNGMAIEIRHKKSKFYLYAHKLGFYGKLLDCKTIDEASREAIRLCKDRAGKFYNDLLKL